MGINYGVMSDMSHDACSLASSLCQNEAPSNWPVGLPGRGSSIIPRTAVQ